MKYWNNILEFVRFLQSWANNIPEIIRDLYIFYRQKRTYKRDVIFLIGSIHYWYFFKPIILKMLSTKMNNVTLWCAVRKRDFKYWGSALKVLDELKALVGEKNVINCRSCNFLRYDVLIAPGRAPRIKLGKCIQTFHGFGSFVTIFGVDNYIKHFDCIFLVGPHHEWELKNLVLKNDKSLAKKLFVKVGYPKIDELFNKCYKRKEILKNAGLNPDRKTVIYAPTFSPYMSSLHLMGKEIIECVLSLNVNLIVKLHPQSYIKDDPYCTEGINWDKELSLYKKYNNFYLAKELNSNPLLFVSDLMISDQSGVGFEFVVALQRAIIFIATPRKKPRKLSGNEVPEGIHVTGQFCGPVVKNTKELKIAIEKYLADPNWYNQERLKLKKMVCFNPGNGADAALEVIRCILNGKKVPGSLRVSE